MSKKVQLELFLLDNLIWVIVAGFFLMNIIVTPNFATYGNFVNILFHSTIMSMLVLGEGLVLIIGALDLSLESIVAFAPGVVMLMATQWIPGGINPVMCIILTLAVGALVGYFNGFFIARIGVNPLLQTLSVEIMLRGLVLFLVPFSIFPLHKIYTYAGQARLFLNIPAAIIIMLIVYVVLHLILQYTTFGRNFMATGGNARASFIAGINTNRMVIAAFVLAGLLAALAGLLAAGRQGSISNTMGQGMIMLAFAGAILGGCSLDGGKGTPLGMLGGTILLGMIDNSLNLLGVGVTLVYATQGALIFMAIIIDRVRAKARSYLLHQEQVKKLAGQEQQA
ncbi:monosaccharide ABC transporter membrane protein, CUT2 family (TC 3.A.1.2.-) [Desulfotomaculum arcticum]|uniref:Autoinducer 2 import system permease protein LsrD n=1 Tax=Desulfotruncus arcticus DSM 17038 TaxID=1121424 RepID=A0A1I2ZQV7_9FIRM|nr:ABC transporter permease [Desulfotruncus arcticus]SFH39996.1 monosaccharide ABC transporter membrane protein, CUT2 family (TC 3.A.1.2.-) [Desulfotomaculum arcticum] [Desulfotruncus arcticus DSM 17038]